MRPTQTRLAGASAQVIAGHFDSKDCSECHLPPDSSETEWAFRFSHAPKGTPPAACLECHDAKRPSGSTASGFRHSTQQAAQGDCVKCHVSQAGKTWEKAVFSHGTNVGFCSDCHASTRPAPWHYEKVDCSYCHKDPGGMWKGSFDHDPTPASCRTCHLGQAPKGKVGVRFFHSAVTQLDCNTCHDQPGISFKGATYPYISEDKPHDPVPYSCTPCHTDKGK